MWRAEGFADDQHVDCSIRNCREDHPDTPNPEYSCLSLGEGGSQEPWQEKEYAHSKGKRELGLLMYLGEDVGTHTYIQKDTINKVYFIRNETCTWSQEQVVSVESIESGEVVFQV